MVTSLCYLQRWLRYHSRIHSLGCFRDVTSRTRFVLGQCTTARPTWRGFMLEYPVRNASQPPRSIQFMGGGGLSGGGCPRGSVEWSGGASSGLFAQVSPLGTARIRSHHYYDEATRKSVCHLETDAGARASPCKTCYIARICAPQAPHTNARHPRQHKRRTFVLHAALVTQ